MVKPFFYSMFIRRFMQVFFNLLYHPFAFTYDLVAATVSFGKWKDWVYAIFPFISGTRILELGHGPGHMQRFLLSRGLASVAIDESAQMGRIAKRRLGTSQKLTRGLAQSLPYVNESFDTVISTFPTEYIFDPSTLAEVNRTLRKDGRLIVLPATFPSNSILRWLYKITGESPQQMDELLKRRFAQPFEKAGFQTEIKTVEQTNATLVLIIAKK